MVTHNAELAYQYATRICRFKDGQLIEDTNPYDPETEIEGQTAETETVIEKIASKESDEKSSSKKLRPTISKEAKAHKQALYSLKTTT